MSTTDELLAANTSFAEGFSTPGLPGPPSRGVAVVACMDARLDVYRVLGLGDGEATLPVRRVRMPARILAVTRRRCTAW